MDAIRIQARIIIVSSERILHPGQVVVRRGRVVDVRQSTRDKPDIDLGDAVLIPGLVNAHTHLEFSDLREALPSGSSFPAWIGEVVGYRAQRGEAAVRDAYAAGLRECYETGTALVADIATPPWQASAEKREPSPQVLSFPEVIGLTPERLQDSFAWAESRTRSTVEAYETSTNNVPFADAGAQAPAFGMSPHAPYSLLHPLAGQLFERLPVTMPLAMHIAESLEERQWLESGQGPFRDAFERLGLALVEPRMQMDEAIGLLLRQERSLLVHGNHLRAAEMDTISKSSGLSVVYCPRTHRHFHNSPYPLEAYRKRGIRVVIGTDSRASSPDLNLWSELVAARAACPSLSAQEGFAAVTESAAHALGCGQDYGTLDVGKLARINRIEADTSVPIRELLESITSAPLRPQPLQGL